MKSAILLLLITTMMLSQTTHRSLRMEKIGVVGVPDLGEPALLGGEYAIMNVHSGRAIGSKRFREGALAYQSDTASKLSLIPVDGGYLIQSHAGFLSESPESGYVRFTEAGTKWQIHKVPASDSFEIIGDSGRALESSWMVIPGDWVRLDERTAASNQEWRIEHPKTIMASQPAAMAHVRASEDHGAGKERVERSTKRPLAKSKLTYRRDGNYWIYSLNVSGSGLTQIFMFRGAGAAEHIRAFSEISTPPGWRYRHWMWMSKEKSARGGVFALRTTYAPGPVITGIIADEERTMRYSGTESAHQANQMTMAAIGTGLHGWAIGPAIPPGADDAKLRALVQTWVNNGLGFLWPLLDDRPIAESLWDVQPETPFERETYKALAAYLGGGK